MGTGNLAFDPMRRFATVSVDYAQSTIVTLFSPEDYYRNAFSGNFNIDNAGTIATAMRGLMDVYLRS